MKVLLPLLLLSFIGNLVLAFQPARPSPKHRETPSSSSGPRPTAVGQRQPAVTAREPEPALSPELRAAIARRDPKELLQALRQAGFPERYVRDMVMAEIDATQSTRSLENAQREAATPFWRLGAERLRSVQDSMEHQRAHRERVREVFGGRPPATDLQAAFGDVRYRFLPAEKIARVSQIDADYAEMASEAMMERGPGPVDRAAIKLLEQERRADLAAILAPDELELFDLYLSPSAEALRRSLGEFQPSEAEFRALVAGRRHYDEEQGNLSLLGISVMSTGNDSRTTENYRQALTPERFAEFQRTQDRGYRAASEIARHYNLPATAAADTYALQQTYQQRLRAARDAAGSDRAAANAAAQAIAAEARGALARILGEAGTEVYLQTGGQWLRSLEQSASRPTPPPSGAQPAIRLPGGG